MLRILKWRDNPRLSQWVNVITSVFIREIWNLSERDLKMLLHRSGRQRKGPKEKGCRSLSVQFSSVQSSHSVMSDSLQPHGLQHTRPSCPSPTPRVYSNSCPMSQCCHPPILSSVIPFSPQLISFPASGSFPMTQFFKSGGQSIGVSASTLVLPMNIQDWFPLGWTGWISLQSKRLSRVFSNTTVQKHQFFSTQLSLESNSHPYITTGKTKALTRWTFDGKVMSL